MRVLSARAVEQEDWMECAIPAAYRCIPHNGPPAVDAWAATSRVCDAIGTLNVERLLK